MNRNLFGAIFIAGLVILGQTSLPAADKSTPPAGKAPLPAGVVREGSLCNQKLISDASIAAAGKLARLGYTYDVHRHTFRPYVASIPQGSPGQRRWTERWVYSIDGKEVPITIDFSEAGLGAVDYAIRR